jgi:hypothetical protein
VTAELGNVTPYIIVPGPWSQEDLEYHATSVASGLAQNAGHNCIAAEVRWFGLLHGCLYLAVLPLAWHCEVERSMCIVCWQDISVAARCWAVRLSC